MFDINKLPQGVTTSEFWPDNILPILQVRHWSLGILHSQDAEVLRGRPKDAADSAHARGLNVVGFCDEDVNALLTLRKLT